MPAHEHRGVAVVGLPRDADALLSLLARHLGLMVGATTKPWGQRDGKITRQWYEWYAQSRGDRG